MIVRMAKNKNLIIVTLVAIVNALGYGIIIPVLYTYSKNFGLSDFTNGLLFATYSLCMFLASPIIGRMSDKFGRKPMLIISISGTVISFLLMAMAQSPVWLFLARALDGFTSGNVPVALAVISDSTEGKDRAKGFGLIGAAFGFGFVFGPAISALTSGFGLAIPFYIAAAVAALAVALVALFLPETNKHIGEAKTGKLFDFKKLFGSIFEPHIGKTLGLSLLYTFAFAMYQYAFQPYAVHKFNFSAAQIGQVLTLFGALGIVSQGLIIPQTIKRLGEKVTLIVSLAIGVLALTGLGTAANAASIFVGLSVFYSFGNAFVAPIIQTLLSREVDAKSQGTILGINASYASIGLIFGPIVAGALSGFEPEYPFRVAAVILAGCIGLAIMIARQKAKMIDI